MNRYSRLAGLMVFLCGALARAEGGAVEATGEAQIKGGDKAAAKQAAVSDALRHCVEQVVGISIKNEFSSQEQETDSNTKSTFMQQVQNSLVQKSEGFIQHYDLVSEGAEGDVYRVKVRATVFESKVKAEVQKLADLLKAAGNPKLMLVIQEVMSSPDGTARVASESIMAAYLEKELLARGFELRGQSAAHKAGAGTLQAYDHWMNDTAGGMKMARDEGADVLIFGRVEIKNQGKITDTGGIDALKDQIRVEIFSVVRGVNTASGEVFSSKPVQMKSMGMSEERAVHRAFKGSGNNLVDQVFGSLLEDLKTSFKKAAEQGQQYMVVLSGVTSYRKQGQRFLEVLRGVNGVSGVTERTFDSSQGHMDVDVMCKCSTAELQQRIFSASEHADVLKNLDLAGASGKRLSFKL